MKFNKTIATLVLFFWTSQITAIANAVPNSKTTRPRLVVMLVIDQFRADYITRFEKRFIPNSEVKIAGFEYLIHHGSYFPFAEFDILQSMTGPGHATVLTGAYPYQMGIPLNDWYNKETHQHVYCTEDQKNPTVGASPKDTHIGTSPKNLLASTVGDELKNAGYSSRVVSIAIKDRAAILMGGHRSDLTLWLDKDSFQWVSSKFYLPNGQLPSWVMTLNQSLAKDKNKTVEWKPSGKGSGLSLEKPYTLPDKYTKALGNEFPHTAKADQSAISLPFGLQLTEKAAEEAVKAYNLGNNDAATDLLAVSFSSHDYLGHEYGPNSREMEEMTVADDQTLSTFFNFLNSRFPNGLQDVVFVLTADHGIPPNPDWLNENRVDAGRINPDKLASQIEEKLNQQFGKPKKGKYISDVESFNFYFDDQVLADKKIKKVDAENIAKTILEKTPGFAHAFSSTDYHERKLPTGVNERQILHTYFEGRSGDVIAIPKPFFFEDGLSVTHMTGYSYDRVVPLILAGPGIAKNKEFSNLAQIIDIAPTLSYLLRIIPPNMSEGRVLSEVLIK